LNRDIDELQYTGARKPKLQTITREEKKESCPSLPIGANSSPNNVHYIATHLLRCTRMQFLEFRQFLPSLIPHYHAIMIDSERDVSRVLNHNHSDGGAAIR
jgi:hypothetical protein